LLQATDLLNDNHKGSQESKPISPWLVFGVLWVLLFALYFPAAKAGFVKDFTGWLDQVRNHSFYENINRTNFKTKSLYQFTQLATFVFYELFGANAWLWHLLFVTLHAINATLIYKVVCRLLNDVAVQNSAAISIAGVLLFCVSPYESEVIVWEPSFHYLQGLLFIMLILQWVQGFMHKGASKYIWWPCLLYAASLFTLEVFYTTPWIVLTMGLFYRYTLPSGKEQFRKMAVYIFIPMMLLFFARMVGYKLAYGEWVSRIGTKTVTDVDINNFGKPAKYLFHLVFLGRFFSQEMRDKVYAFCDSLKCIIAFYSVVILICGYIAFRFKGMSGKAKVASLIFVWALILLMLLIPMWFHSMFLVLFDRYAYFASPFVYMLVALLISTISMQYVRIGVFVAYLLINTRFLIKVNRYWWKSEKVIHGLLYDLPDPGSKTLLLLNLPEAMNGIPMIGWNPESEYKLMHDLLLPDKKLGNNVYDVISYNMLTPDDGAHATVMNDSTIRVTLNQWGTWWWGENYENKDYKISLIDPGHWYELTLKRPEDQYMLLFQVGDKWKVVDMSKRNTDQN